MDNKKPVAPLIGASGNIFNLLSIARNSLISSNKQNEADEMWNRVTNSKSYNEALIIIGDYVGFGESEGQTLEGLEENRQQKDCNQRKFISSEENTNVDNDNSIITKVDFTQELHITNSVIDEIMSIVLEEGIFKWYKSISSSSTNIEKVEPNIISNGGTIFFRIQGEDYNRTFDRQDLTYGLLRKLPDCLYVINGTQIDTTSLSNEDIDHIIQYGIFG